MLICIFVGSSATKEIEDEEPIKMDKMNFEVKINVNFHSLLSKQNLRTLALLKKKKQPTASQKKVLEIKAEKISLDNCFYYLTNTTSVYTRLIQQSV